MSFAVKVVEHSHNGQGHELATLQLMYPRFIHAEMMTHRVFSRNASSSRAIPVAKMLEQIRNDPAMPIHWGKNQPGMQAAEELTGESLAETKGEWGRAAMLAADSAEYMMEQGAHKQVVNRILEPFQHIHVIVTATEWDNFFALRCHEDAQPEIHHLAVMMREAMAASVPKLVGEGDWHLPYVTTEERAELGHELSEDWCGVTPRLIQMSAARCARVSYMTHDGQAPSMEKDLALFDRLVGGEPIHASPIEHQATPSAGSGDPESWETTYTGNFHGWVQFRKIFEKF